LTSKKKERKRKQVLLGIPMEALVRQLVEEVDLEGIRRGMPIDFMSLSPEKKKEAVQLALHCCINGPVSVHGGTRSGTNQPTNFPGFAAPLIIKQQLGLPLMTNSNWSAFCSVVKRFIPPNLDCIQVRLHGDYWPQ